MAASLRHIAGCIGITGCFSVVKDFYGYESGVYGHKSIDVDIQTMTLSERETTANDPGRLSLRRQVELLKTRFFNLDMIRVGGDDFTALEQQEVDIAVQIARELYERVDIGIGRVLAWHIPVADAGGYMSIDDHDEACDLIDEWSAPGDGVDCFFARVVNTGGGGATPEKGDGVVVSLMGDWGSGIGLAHELGHALGVHYHLGNPQYLMASAFPIPPYKWRSAELDLVKNSASMHPGCT